MQDSWAFVEAHCGLVPNRGDVHPANAVARHPDGPALPIDPKPIRTVWAWDAAYLEATLAPYQSPDGDQGLIGTGSDQQRIDRASTGGRDVSARMVSVSRTTGVILLNGASSAGKSTLAAAIQHLLEPEWIVIGVDDWLGKVDARWWESDSTRARPALAFLPTDDGGLMPRANDAGERLFAGYRAAVAAFASCGIGVIVDEVCLQPAWWADWEAVLSGHRVLRVGVRCPLLVAEERERERGDRALGLARGITPIVHEGIDYDLDIDTSLQSAKELAQAVVDEWRSQVG